MFKSKKNRLLAAILTLIMAFGLITPTAMAEEKEITVFVNGIHLEPDTPPIVEDGRTLVPLRAVFEAMGAEVGWDDYYRTATVEKDGITVSVTIDQPYMTKNGQSIPLDVPARIVNGRTMIPVRAVSEALEAKVEWDGEHRWVLVTIAKNASYSTLTPTDMAKLKENYDSLRFGFEQVGFSSFVLANPEVCAECLRTTDELLLYVPYGIWAANAAALVELVQKDSNTDYQIPVGLTEDELAEAYYNIIDEAGFDPMNHFETSYETMPSGGNMLLLSFFSVDEGLLPCMYIGVTTDLSGNVRYFTGETDPNIDGLFLCEVTEEGHIVYGSLDIDKATFIKAVDIIARTELIQSYS